ncbi:MAG: hypothetical protein DI534_13830 [Leifsonia xyli]|nr:MAG: hypothetical protein DI534_13830 [Leifsonia xyli]
MIQVPGAEPPRKDGAAAAYPPPYPAADATNDDELAAALAAQKAMYTGPISLPVLNSDPVFQPDPNELNDELPPPGASAPMTEDLAPPAARVPTLPPVPVPPPAAPPEYIAPDAVASDPAPESDAAPLFAASVDAVPFDAVPAAAAPEEDLAWAPVPPASPLPTASSQPLPDEELSRTVEQEAAAGSTLDAILMLENELRRRQGLAPVADADEPPAEAGAALGGGWDPAPFAPPPAVPPASVIPGVDVPDPAVAAFDAPTLAEPEIGGASTATLAGADAFAAYHSPAAAPIPGWTDAPDPEREGELVTSFAPPVDLEQPVPLDDPAALAAPAYTELPPPAAETADDRAWLTAPPPTFAAPMLVEPPLEPAVGTVDPAILAAPQPGVLAADFAAFAPPTVGEEQVDVSQLPPPAVGSVAQGPVGFEDAPAPVVTVVSAAAPSPVDPEAEGIDALDRADLAPPISVEPGGEASIAPLAPAPVSTATVVAVGEPVAEEPSDPSAAAVEKVGVEPTPLERRAGHAARLFWLWFAANSSVVIVAVAATLFIQGMSLRQVLVAVVAGVALSALPLGLGSLAGKWSGQPTMVVSRATFGIRGNVVPAVLAVLGRALWGGVLLWLVASSAIAVIAPQSADAPVPALAALAVGGVLAAIVAVVGYGLLHRVQRVLGILSLLLVVVTIVATASRVDIAASLRTDDGSWLLAIGGVVTVFSVVGLAWAQSSSDLARYQNPAGSGAANMLWGSFAVILPTLAILSWGAVLAASDPALAEGLASAPLATLVAVVPAPLALPLLGATSFGLVAGAIVTMYSGGLAILAVGARLTRAVATLIAAVLVIAVGAGLLLLGVDTRDIVSDIATTLAVPVAAWTGIFASEMMIRLRRFHSPSLLAAGGVYPSVRWVNLVGLIVISAIGFGFTTAQLAGLQWEGYLFSALGIGSDNPLAATDAGVLVALVLGLLLPLASGIPAIRRQESDREAEPVSPAPAAPLVD